MSDEVSDFLRSVEALKGRREEVGEARSRELEEKILQEKRERQARRAERARSISPQKSSPANTPPPGVQTQQRSGTAQPLDESSAALSRTRERSGSPQPRPAVHSPKAMEHASDYSNSTKENEYPFDSGNKRISATLTSPSGGMPSSRTPLSWQRRPPSQSSDRTKSRPLSVVAAENAAARSSPTLAEATSPTEQTFSRDQIAESLSGKDPSWFRQTADRAQNSAAYRRNQVEDQDTTDVSASMRAQLPGMARDAPAELSKVTSGSRPSSPAIPGRFGSPFSLNNAPRLDPPTRVGAGDRAVESKDLNTVSSPDGRTSPTRPVSPTKGMGGFVQSAMMKRTDSVKRWSVTSSKGLQRGDSVSLDSPGARPSSTLREGLTTPASEPSHEKEEGGQLDSSEGAEPRSEADKTTPPSSPSRTMDPRRWSPTKSSSWLDAALNKPESPKPKPGPPPSNQPAWMIELNKAKAQKANGGSADPGQSSSALRKHEVRTGGLMRSTPMGASVKPTGLGNFPGLRTGDKPVAGNLRSNLNKPTSRDASEDPEGQADERRGSAGGEASAVSKTKPDTPPKKDFRANLRPRVPPPESATSEPTVELKSVVGNLRRTKTQNYVAPDELKSNILRGKAALNLTGGPKKSEKKDELKEAILKKKEDFRKAQLEGHGVSRTPSVTNEEPLPEGLAKKLELGRPGTLRQGGSSTTFPPGLSPPLESNGSGFVSPVTPRALPEIAPKSVSVSYLNTGNTLDAIPPPPKGSDVSSRVSASAKVGSGGLADKFHPGLANLLARGPPGMASTSGSSSAVGTSGGVGMGEVGEPTGPGPQLTHMTKNRARGPKRKAPTSVAKLSGEPEQKQPMARLEQRPEPRPNPLATKSLSPTNGDGVSSYLRSEQPPAAEPKKAMSDSRVSPVDRVITLGDSSKLRVEEEVKPAGEAISVRGPLPLKTRPRSPTKVHEQAAALAAMAAKDQQVSKPVAVPDAPVSQPSSPRKLDMKRVSRFIDEGNLPPPQAEPEKSEPSSPIKRRPLPPPATLSSQTETPHQADIIDLATSPKAASPQAGRASFALPAFSSAQMSVHSTPTPMRDQSAPESSTSVSRSPPKGARPMPMSTHMSRGSTQPTAPLRSPTKYGLEVSAMLTEFFGPARPRRNYSADAADILMRRPSGGSRIQTQKAQLFQLSGDGKKQPVRSHYERVLFEREIYLCTHSFFDEGGKRVNEVYFWAGDEVPESMVDDAHVFAQREARSFGGKLVKLEQGKETPEFIQALGGILIVRRGSSNRYDSLAPNMLCGRRYLGQVAFDEVDFSPATLCSGFPYLITHNGKCYLWKGKGSDVDELGCARLVGMDLALNGELAEVEDGCEPAGFWDVFGGDSRPQSADHWRLKPNYDKYCGRLFHSNPADKRQIVELSPFTQTDLLPSNIYVLDAFFEMYVIVGARSQHQYAAFHNALDFAQEYAILAAGMEDRPFIPVSTVVLEGVPRDLKSVFRKWHDAASPTASASASASAPATATAPRSPTGPDLRRGRSLRVVPLNQALQALTE